MKNDKFLKLFIIGATILTLVACSQQKNKRAQVLYDTHCSSCHSTPRIEDLPKNLWKNVVLPNMGARMGIRDSTYNPFSGYTFLEQNAMIKSGIYNTGQTITQKDWNLLKEYIIASAPDSVNHIMEYNSDELQQFYTKPIHLEGFEGAFITFLEFDKKENIILIGKMDGSIISYDVSTQTSRLLNQMNGAVTSYNTSIEEAYITMVGKLDPSEIPEGKLYEVKNNKATEIPEIFHRPVHTLVHDFDGNGHDEILVCEFGNLTGKLSLLKKNSESYAKNVLLNMSGTIRTVAFDMNNDGRDDIVAMTSQGNEGISILYQRDSLQFRSEQVIRLSPVYGSSWFELLDYDGDGDQDIVTVNGDNADNTFILKPYHGMRIYLNDGTNRFEEKYFYPLNGATRVVSSDFDKDGDNDFALVASFPDYKKNPILSFVFLENKDSENFTFETFTFKDANLGRWLLMDTGDFDRDGDEDIVLSSFTYSFTPVPKAVSEIWKESKTELLILENTLVK